MQSSNPQIAKKKDLRAYFLHRRQALSLPQAAQFSEEIAQAFIHYFDLQNVQYLHVFLPIQEKREVNTLLLIQKLRQDYPQIHIVASRSNLNSREMEHLIWDAQTPLLENRWGIPEPAAGEKVSEKNLDVILIPLLGFDQRGFRVGYGKGFYDRFLSKCAASALKIGLSFFEPVEEIIDIEPTDIALDYCIVNQKVLKLPS